MSSLHAPSHAPLRILCFGDSNTWGAAPDGSGRLAAEDRWTGVMAAHLGQSWTVIEEGMRGRTTRLDDLMVPGSNGAAYLAPCLVTHQPLDLVILMLGVNDLKDRLQQSAADVGESISFLLTLIRGTPQEGPSDRRPEILLVAPPRLGPRGTAFSAVYAQADAKAAMLTDLLGVVAARTGTPFFDAGNVVTITEGDGVHFAAPFHRALGKALVSRVLQLGIAAVSKEP